MDKTRATAHGRDEIRRLKAATVPGLPFPHADQVNCRSYAAAASWPPADSPSNGSTVSPT